jgi:hypothetical protein
VTQDVRNRDIKVIVARQPVEDTLANGSAREPAADTVLASDLHQLLNELEHVCLLVTALANNHLDQDLLFRGAVAN